MQSYNGVLGWDGVERVQPGQKTWSAGGEETAAPAGPEAFSLNANGEFYDPTFKRWMPSQGPNAWNMDFRKQVAANLANGNSAVWSSQTGWDQRSPIPAAWGSQPSAPPVPTGANPAWGPMMADPDHAFTGMAPGAQQQTPAQTMPGLLPTSVGGYTGGYTGGAAGQGGGKNTFGFNPMNQFFQSYWGK